MKKTTPALVLPPAPVAPVVPPNRELVSSWSLGSMGGYLRDLTRYHIGLVVAEVDAAIAAGSTDHIKVMSFLGGCEEDAPADERAAHMARTDAYAAFYGLRGWYRYDSKVDDPEKAHRVQVNFLRTAVDGERGRYYIHDYSGPLKGSAMWGARFWIVDRDCGETVLTSLNRRAAKAWIAEAEGR